MAGIKIKGHDFYNMGLNIAYATCNICKTKFIMVPTDWNIIEKFWNSLNIITRIDDLPTCDEMIIKEIIE